MILQGKEKEKGEKQYDEKIKDKQWYNINSLGSNNNCPSNFSRSSDFDAKWREWNNK